MSLVRCNVANKSLLPSVAVDYSTSVSDQVLRRFVVLGQVWYHVLLCSTLGAL